MKGIIYRMADICDCGLCEQYCLEDSFLCTKKCSGIIAERFDDEKNEEEDWDDDWLDGEEYDYLVTGGYDGWAN